MARVELRIPSTHGVRNQRSLGVWVRPILLSRSEEQGPAPALGAPSERSSLYGVRTGLYPWREESESGHTPAAIRSRRAVERLGLRSASTGPVSQAALST